MIKIKKRTAIIIAAIFLIVLTAVLFSKYNFSSKFDSGKIQTGFVDSGSVMTGIKAQGIVEPHNEVIINGPANTKILKIIHEPGSHVKAGDTILILDRNPILDEIENLRDQLNMKKNSLEKNQLNARSTKLDLDYNIETKKLRIASIKSDLEDEKQLLEVGGISPAKLEKTKQSLVSAEKDLTMSLEKNMIRLKQLEAEKKGLKLQIDIQERKLEAKHAQLFEMMVTAPSDGIILNITKGAEERVKMGELLVSMSNLSSFKIIGSLDEEHADYLKTGKSVYAIIDKKERIPGKVGNVKPVIENSKMNFEVYLENPSHKKLIPNMKIELILVKDKKENVLRITKGSAFNNDKIQEVYLKKDNKAFLTEIETGLKGEKYIEIISGVLPGDEIIISDVSTLSRKKTIDLN